MSGFQVPEGGGEVDIHGGVLEGRRARERAKQLAVSNLFNGPVNTTD